MMGWPMFGWGPGWGWMALAHVLWLLLIAGGVALLLRWVWRRGARTGEDPDVDRALAILRERYARGEIDDAEFTRRKTVLGA